MRNYYIFAAALAVFCIALIAASFSIVGTPFEQKAKTLDSQRMNDFYTIARDIEDYYYSKHILPVSLSEVQKNASTYSNPSVQDPQTKKDYDYETINGYSYKLCTTFSSDTTTESDDTADSSTYTSYLKQYAKDRNVTHKKGHDCIVFEILPSERYGADENTVSPTPTPIPDPIIITKPAYKDRLCLGQEYTIEWTADPDVTSVNLYLVTPSELKDKFDNPFLIDSEKLSPGQKINPSDPKSKYKGSYTWKIGMVESRGDQVSVPEDSGYAMGAEDQRGKVNNTDNFVIVDCAKNPVGSTIPTPTKAL
jgi:hypothetical protein